MSDVCAECKIECPLFTRMEVQAIQQGIAPSIGMCVCMYVCVCVYVCMCVCVC